MGIDGIGPVMGLIREGTIRRYNTNNGTVRVGINMAKTDSSIPVEYDMPIPASWSGPNGEFSGGFPAAGSTVWCALSQGGRWSVLQYSKSDDVFGNKNTSNTVSSQRDLMSALRPGRWLTQVKGLIRLFVDPEIGVQAGSPSNYIQIDPIQRIYSNVSGENLTFTDANRHIIGQVKRDIVPNSNRNISGSALTSHTYNSSLRTIGLDPLTITENVFNRNPAFVENRSITYEFSNTFGFTNDATEVTIYDNNNKQVELQKTFDRTKSRADTLSLSLAAPNQLIETTKGTVVDLYGNLLDINRAVLPSGKIDQLSFRTTEKNKSETFTALREQARKTIAYHFELNARKASVPDNNSITNPVNYARDRSRFFIDVDKEGQFKINIPASSEVGNVPLLTRYENYSTLKAVQDGSTPNQFIRNADNQDIFIESFGVGAVTLNGGNSDLNGFVAPVDRITNEPIKLGTAYHDLQKTVELHNRQDPVFWYENSTFNSLPLLGDVVSPMVTVSGPDANAGGRSGTISLDGSVSLNIGANTVDRQSVWLDAAGGMVFNIGRDLNGRSLLGRFDGDIFVQVGGATVANDSRFGSVDNDVRAGTVDLRIVSTGSGSNGNMTIIRVDSGGNISIASPGTVDIVSHGTMRLNAIGGDLLFNARGIYFYADDAGRGRWVQRKSGQTI
jgi:hypothetical protein